MNRQTDFTRRSFALAAGSFGIAGAGTLLAGNGASGELPAVRFGIATDSHFGDLESTKPPHEVRAFRESAGKMREFVDAMNVRKVDFLVELGDFVEHHATREKSLASLDAIESEFARFRGPRYHVLGNHDLQTVTREEFVRHAPNSGDAAGRTFYSFGKNGFTFIVLDHGYFADGTPMVPGRTDWTKGHVSAEQWRWLDSVLADAKGKVVVFSHWRLDPLGSGGLTALDADRMRKTLEKSGKAIASFSGHHHYGHYMNIGGIGYYCLKAMCTGSGAENNSYAEVSVYPSGKVRVAGFRRAESKVWPPASGVL